MNPTEELKKIATRFVGYSEIRIRIYNGLAVFEGKVFVSNLDKYVWANLGDVPVAS